MQKTEFRNRAFDIFLLWRTLRQRPKGVIIINLGELLNTIDDNKERLKRIKELNFKLVKLNMNRKKPLTFEDFPEYEGKLIDKLTKIPDKYCK